MVKIKLPSAMRAKTGSQNEISVEATDVAQALRQLEATYPALTPTLRDERGVLRPVVNIYVNDVHIRFRQGLRTPLQDGDHVYVVPVVMGG
jgi:molybdopterin converting factor small subunit